MKPSIAIVVFTAVTTTGPNAEGNKVYHGKLAPHLKELARKHGIVEVP